jgi:hypothetical protein
LRVFVSSTLQELADERTAARQAIGRLRLAPVLFELGARPHPPRSLYRAYLAQSDIFVGIYWQRYGWVAPGENVSGLEDEYLLSGIKPKLIYIKTPAGDREPRLAALLDRIRADDHVSYKSFRTPSELRRLLADDLALLLTERFALVQDTDSQRGVAANEPAPAEADAADTTSARRATNLVPSITNFVGREHETAEIKRLLGTTRLLTLTGPGGVGKTRLALGVAESLVGTSTDGVCLVELAPVVRPEAVARAVADALGVRDDPSQPLTIGIATALANQTHPGHPGQL